MQAKYGMFTKSYLIKKIAAFKEIRIGATDSF